MRRKVSKFIGRFSILFLQDVKIALRNYFHIFLLIIFALMVGIFHLLPEEIDILPSQFIYDESGIYTEAAGTAAASGAQLLKSKDELIESVNAENGSVGIYIPKNISDGITVYTNGSPESRSARLIKALISYRLGGDSGSGDEAVLTLPAGLEYETLGEDRISMTIPELMLPILLIFEVVILGFLFVAVMVFQEKQEGSIRAYRVAPGGAAAYTLSKILVWTFFSILYGIFLLAATTGLQFSVLRWLMLLLLLTAGAFFMTAVGLLVSTFFKGISDWFFIGIAVLIVFTLPQISLAAPGFSPSWLRFIPSYPLVFAVRDILYAKTAVFPLQPLLLFLVLGSAAYIVAYGMVKFKLLKEAH
jgi:ABC-2 type transport system permease protein/fluoroquinolone transport system permease protein